METILRSLAPRLAGRRLVQARFLAPLVLRGRPDEIERRLRNRTIGALERRGKFLLFRFRGGSVLAIHLGMTGRLLWDGTPGPHTRALFELEGGRLIYDDVRQFGRIELSEALPARVARLGPDPLSIPAAQFAARLRARRGRIKPLLLNQLFLGGLGNIYADEALFRARIHPLAAAGRLSAQRAQRLHQAIQEVLLAAIESGGSSISDYVDGEGRPGAFQLAHQVYGRLGRPCPLCATPIRRIVVSQRGTHYCPRCQRR